MLDLVGWTRTDALNFLGPLGWLPEDRPTRFRRMELGGSGAESGRPLVIESEGWVEVGGRLNLKYARVRSALLDIATIMCYPTASPELLPIFAAEWVVVARKCHALILDVETVTADSPLRARMEPIYKPLARPYQEAIPENRERPEWFNQIATPWAIYGAAELEILPVVRAAFRAYLDQTIERFYKPALPAASSGGDHPDVVRYKHHHAINSPGYPLFRAKMGEELAREFLFNWHFGPPRIPRARVETVTGSGEHRLFADNPELLAALAAEADARVSVSHPHLTVKPKTQPPASLA